MVSVIATANISQLEAAFNADLCDQQNPLQTAIFVSGVSMAPGLILMMSYAVICASLKAATASPVPLVWIRNLLR
jgi:hypothetical protein